MVRKFILSTNSCMEWISSPLSRAGRWKNPVGVLISINIFLLIAVRILVLMVFRSVLEIIFDLERCVNKEIALAWIIFLRLRGSNLRNGRYVRDCLSFSIFFLMSSVTVASFHG